MKRMGMVLILMLVMAGTAMSAVKAESFGPYKATSVAEAKTCGVDTGVVLSGHLVRKVKDNVYLFSDGTGELLLQTEDGALDNVDMQHATVNVNGRIASSFMYTEVEATTVTVQ